MSQSPERAAIEPPRVTPEPRAESELTFRVVPCLDVRDGRVVKGVQFRELRDLGDPAESATRYADEGADEIVFLDIGAAPEGRDTRLDWVERTAERVFVPLTVGGGVRSVEDAGRLLRSGADKVGVNSAAVDDPALLGRLAERYGAQCVVLSVDAARRSQADGSIRWEVVTHGGRTPRGLDVLEWIERGIELGAGEILLTSIDADGTRDGYDVALLRAVAERVRVPIVASGGAGTLDHLAEALDAGSSAVLAASIFHEGTFRVDAVKRALRARGYAMRPPLDTSESIGDHS
ncbi:MAG: imidazole glycerol phosphate synthase subunit HisF [Acidobacteriota bacterium]